MSVKTYKAIGLMSGSSLDGLDIAFCEFQIDNKNLIDWKLLKAETIPFSEKWQGRLVHLPQQDALIYAKTHAYLGHYFGDLVNDFLEKHQVEPDFIASHGHTIFHYPNKRMTAQIGDGAALAASTGYPVIADFRTQDIALDGEGTPLAPTADKFLFQGYDFYMNIGGIANISCNANGKMIAFDIGGANQVLNGLAQLADMEFDDDGQLAATGEIENVLLNELNNIPYFAHPYPKSLDNQWVFNNLLKKYLEYEAPVENRLRTACEQLAIQTVLSIEQIIQKEALEKDQYQMLVTGGGVLNSFLMENIRTACNEKIDLEIVIPEKEVIEFKEAALMALLGVLRVENIPNCMASVTGAKRDTIGGAIYQGFKKKI